MGPDSIRTAALEDPSGVTIRTRDDLARWAQAQADWIDGELIATFVVVGDGALRVAPRRSEHVACALGAPVLAAGELVLRGVSEPEVAGASNQSTGYCPEPSCWSALASALTGAGIPAPERFTAEYTFRKCPKCGERNLVKDDWYQCALCDADLPRTWNFDG